MMIRKKRMAFLLALALLLSLLPAPVWAADGVWEGSGTEEDPWQIESVAGLRALAEAVGGGENFEGKYFALVRSQHLNSKPWTPIGSGETPFAGTFLGCGHSILGLKIEGEESTRGLFGVLTGRVEHLSVSGEVAGNQQIGGIAGVNRGEIVFCDFSGSVSGTSIFGGLAGINEGSVADSRNLSTVTGSVESPRVIGGIAGANTGSIERCTNDAPVNGFFNTGGVTGTNAEGGTISDCLNTEKGTVTGGNYTGGIVGWLDSGSTFAYCTNRAAVSGTYGTGGIAGIADDTILGCLNTGTVDGNGDTYIGGIAGGRLTSDIIDCTNTGAVRGAATVGGIAAHLAGEHTVSNCLNSGRVENIAAHEGTAFTGGIVGYAPKNAKVTGCTNTGEITGPEDITFNLSGTGGIVGSAESAIVEQCVNSGKITGLYWVGGMIGNAALLTAVTGCTNSGAVQGKYGLGGITGYVGTSTVTGCRNTGTIGSSDAYSVGGIAGSIFMDITAVLCINQGAVSGAYKTGGILGHTNSSGTIDQCRNEGSVTAMMDEDGKASAGGIVGCGSGALSVRQCANTGAVEGGGAGVGGLVGEFLSGLVEDSYNRGFVHGTLGAGGLVGVVGNTGYMKTVQRCYCKAPAKWNSLYGVDSTPISGYKCGALIGALRNDDRSILLKVTLKNNIWWSTCADRALGYDKNSDHESHDDPENDYGWYAKEERFKDPANFPNWVFEAEEPEQPVWYIDQEAGVPRCFWEKDFAITDPAGADSTSGKGGKGGKGANGDGMRLALSGGGSLHSPYLIASAEDWNELAAYCAAGGSTRSLYFRQTADISVAVMAGVEAPFTGSYDGQGHTLEVHLSAEGVCAPFVQLEGGAVLKSLRVTGTVEGGESSAGLAGRVAGDTSIIRECLVNTAITGSGRCGGIVGTFAANSSLALEICAFTGSITAPAAGGFIGWGEDVVIDLKQCIEEGSAYHCTEFDPVGNGKAGLTQVESICCAHDPAGAPEYGWTNEITPASRITGQEGTVIAPGEATATYPVSGIKVCGDLLWREEKRYYLSPGKTADLVLSCTTPLQDGEELLRFAASGGELTETSGGYTLRAGTGEIVIGPVLRKVTVEGDTLTYRYARPADGSEVTVIAAWYGENGRMLGCAADSFPCTGVNTGTLTVGENAAKYKLFFLDGESRVIEKLWEK